ncbi:PREDICTED: uncharacterized protein LOC106818874 [Priapulus caudatus]|uniref:Uncharacterized protein LOC106818874 n=1 Tax=Priapulus caudatus TaxID=37621 RepID=A0ABM1F3K8_PRICU|nr:PREDICTED: uncharacterized protein LOC106818874 [Priapulus caudatus]
MGAERDYFTYLLLRRKMWISILCHVVNKHSWNYGTVFHRCAHEVRADDSNTGYLRPGSSAHKLLRQVVMDRRLLSDMSHLPECCHTGHLEVYHSLHLKYASKRIHFVYKGRHSVRPGRTGS